jgi:diguanylate cyclase (GGDEF)-like protein
MSTALPIRALLVAEQRSSAEAFAASFEEPLTPLDRRIAIAEARSAPEAFGRGTSGAFDLVFLDLKAEGVHPLDVLARHRTLGEHAPVIVLAPDDATGAQAVLSGAYDYLVPSATTPDVIRRTVRSVLERRRLERALQTLEHNDSLTGLLNRRGFYAAAEPRLRQGWRGKGTWVLLIDVDGLRRINDRLGYTAGNEALIAIATAIKGSIRGSDLAARIGGDEFCVMLLDAGRDAALAMATRMQRKLDAFVQERRVPLTVSFGTAHCEPKSSSSVDQLIRLADEELGKARGAGRATRDAGVRA